MSGDYSRITFDPWQDDLGVLLQQGRPVSDAEWNALTLQLRRRIHAGTLDTIGPAVVPMETPDGFEISFIAGGLGIGRGRIYVDGMPAENHGGGAKTWEPRLEDLIGTQVLSYAPLAGFDTQPYYPNPPALPNGGPHLIYLDVWQREVTYLIRPELIEKAVGVDSTTRLQTVWQVKLLNDVGPDANCSTPLDQIPGWLPANAHSAGRLTTSTAPVPGQPDPCLIPPAGGYKGLENQLYRIEIHTAGGLGTATFKWSRENASVETRITHIPALDQLTVESIGKDSVLRFSDGDWVEITDDWLELHNQPGELRRIKIGNGVDDATRTIILEDPLTAGLFPVDAQNRTQPERHTRIKRWDQRGPVLDQNGNVLQDLDLATSNGEITVPPGSGVSVLLEHGIIATFTLDPAGGQFKSGDYWVFAARSTDATIEELDHAPPRGIHHHYAKLGFVTFPSTISDCRIFWPLPIPEGGDNCACTVCVTPQDHASGQMTVQVAIDQVIQAGGGTVCLEVGNYALAEPVRIEGARSVRLTGKGVASRLQNISAGGAVVINKSQDITLDSFSILCRGSVTTPQSAIQVIGSHMIRVERLLIRVESESPLWAAITLADALMDISLRENAIMAPNGIRSGSDPTGGGAAGLADMRIENNTFECSEAAVRLAPISVHQLVNRICGNRVIGCQDAGFILTGITTPGFGVEIASNVLSVLGHGIVASMSGLSVLDNDILQTNDADPKQQRGIFLAPGPTASNLIADCQILENRIAGFNGAGIFVIVPLRSAMIKQNQIAHVGAGLVLESPGVLDQLSIENNQFDDVSGPVLLAKGEGARYAATGNQIRARGADPAVIMEFETGDGVFSHNECYREGSVDAPDVVLQANTLIVGNNRVVGGGISLELHVIERHYTVLGNICRGKIIVVPGGGLPPPWAPLNLEGVV
jgi:hypothetical protein